MGGCLFPSRVFSSRTASFMSETNKPPNSGKTLHESSQRHFTLLLNPKPPFVARKPSPTHFPPQPQPLTVLLHLTPQAPSSMTVHRYPHQRSLWASSSCSFLPSPLLLPKQEKKQVLRPQFSALPALSCKSSKENDLSACRTTQKHPCALPIPPSPPSPHLRPSTRCPLAPLARSAVYRALASWNCSLVASR